MRSAAWRPELPQRFQVRFCGRGIAAVAGDHGRHIFPRRAGVGEQAEVHGELVGGRLGQVAVEAERLARAADGISHQAAVDGGHRVGPVLEGGGDAEVAAAAPQCPEQVLVFLDARGDDLPGRGDHLHRQQVVDGEAVLAHQPAFSAAEGQPRDAGGGDHPAGGGQPVAGRGPVELFPGDAALRPDSPPRRIDSDSLHRREVDHQAAVSDRETGDAVAAAAHGNLGCLIAANVHRVHDVGDGAAPGDERGPLVDQAVVHPAGLLVSRVCGADQLTGERRPYLVGSHDRVAHLISPLAVLRAAGSTMPCRTASGVSPACQHRVAG